MSVPLEIPPGVVRQPTKASNSSNWYDAHLMRWVRNRLQPVGGWSKMVYTATASQIRAVHQWRDNGDRFWTAYLCDAHLYVEYDGNLVDITPVGGIAPPGTSLGVGGYGFSLYDLAEYGTARPDNPDFRTIGFAFSIDNWGENLLAMTSEDGRLLQWVPSLPPTPATVVEGAPVNNRSFVVTPQRFVLLFDYGGNRGDFAWCDQEDITDWNFATVNTKAGFLPIEPRGKNVCAWRVPDGVLHFNTQAAYISRYIGGTFIFDVNILSEGNIPVSDRAIADTDTGAIWMGSNGFWQYNGVSVAPLDCQVWHWIVERIDWRAARFYTTCVNMREYSELWFFFPKAGSMRNDHYVIFNYREGWWSTGNIGRTAGYDTPFTDYPVMADGTNVYAHENSISYPGAELPWIETFEIHLPDGRFATFRQMEPDIEGDIDGPRFSLKYRPQLASAQSQEKQSPLRKIYDGRVDFDVTAKAFRLRVDNSSATHKNWTMGSSLIDVKPRGKLK